MTTNKLTFFICFQFIFFANSSKIFVGTYNTDALLQVQESQGSPSANLAFKIGKIINNENKEGNLELIVLHFQEIVSCASLLQSIKLGFSVTLLDIDLDYLNNQASKPKKQTQLTTQLIEFANLLAFRITDKSDRIKTNEYPIYKCSRIIFYQALGSVICHKLIKGIRTKVYSMINIHYGEFGNQSVLQKLGNKLIFPIFKNKKNLFKFGFKGGLVIFIQQGNKIASQKYVFINLHVSSKSLQDRRYQFMEIIDQVHSFIFTDPSYKKMFAVKSLAFFMAGDFNARTGANFKTITDKNFFKTENFLNTKMKNCFKLLKWNFPSKNELSIDLFTNNFKVILENKLGERHCSELLEGMIKVDEYKDLFSNHLNLLTRISYCNFLSQTENQQHKPSFIYSPIREAQIDFLPSFCFSKTDQTYGCHRPKELTSYADRIFFATKISKEVSVGQTYTHVKPIMYKANLMDFKSDHAFVYGTFEVTQDKLVPKWLTKMTQISQLLPKHIQQHKDCLRMISTISLSKNKLAHVDFVNLMDQKIERKLLKQKTLEEISMDDDEFLGRDISKQAILLSETEFSRSSEDYVDEKQFYASKLDYSMDDIKEEDEYLVI